MNAIERKGPLPGEPFEKHINIPVEEYIASGIQAMSNICPAVTVALALEELDRLHALEQLPTPELLMERLQTRNADFNLLAGVCAAYLRNQGVLHV
mgnify:CR=1 FL=1